MHTSHRVRRTVTTAAALGLSAAGVLTTGAAGSAGAAPSDTRTQSQATPTATASRTTRLAAAGDEVTVTARGFTPGAKVTVALYGGDVADAKGTRTLVADAGGFVATPLVVGTTFAPDATSFEIRTSAAGGPTAKVAVTFAAAAPKAGDVRTARSAPLSAQAPNAPAAQAPQAPKAAGGVKITVNPSSDIDPAGATLTVTGSGYAAGSGTGIYVVFGPKAADWTTNAGNYGASKWLKAVPAPGSDSINADGTFSVKLADVKATYKDGAGKDVDCLKTECYILTMAAHGSPDRSQDAFAKVTFKGGAATTGGTTAGTTGATTGGTTTGGTTGATTTGGATGTTTGGTTGTTTTGATTAGSGAKSGGGGSLPLTGPAGLATAGVVGAGLIAAGTFAVVTTRRRRASTPPTTA